MARREVRCLGTAALIAAALSAALIWARLPSAEAITDPSSWRVKAQDGGTGAPGGGAGLGGASPSGASARLEGASHPGARERPGGASPPGARARPDGAPPPPGVDLDGASLGAGARPSGTSPPPTARRLDGAPPPPAARARPGGAPPPPAARARPGGDSPPGARIRLYGARGRPGGPSTAAVRAWPEVASSAPGADVRLAGSSPDGGAPVSGTSPSTPPCKDSTFRQSGKPKPAPEHHQATAGAVLPPPTPQKDKSVEKRIVSRAMLVLGCLYSLLSFCTPVITFWSTARSVEATYAFHGWFDLFASALGSFGWLLFSISQLHGEDGQILGIAAIVVNAFGFAFYATYIVVKLAVAGYMGTKTCLGVMLVFLGAYISAIMISVYGPMKRESSAAKIVSIVAFAVQIISQIIPLFTVCPLLWSMILPPQNEQRPEHINTRKLTVYSRVGNFGLSLFWVSYCSMTYEHDFFQLANDVGAVLSFVSMVLHLVYTLHPHAVDYPPAAADV